MPDGKEVIEKNGQIFAHVIRKSYRPDGVNFLTPDAYTLQLGLIGHPEGRHIRDHIHNPHIHYQVDTTQEFLYVEQGKIKATIYDYGWNVIKEVVLNQGDILLQVSGGHGFDVLEPSYLIEIKQGPFPGDKLMKFYKEEPTVKS
ncbi:MAG: hypothetical protein UX64_C0014G0013 [Microgenomates group bacterium GW2011_GWC2_46_7]|nr:MAG: hypothetical protein UX64_C0014G0013 [Microgenomates group bacterium GW2011_GWC2_46_7]